MYIVHQAIIIWWNVVIWPGYLSMPNKHEKYHFQVLNGRGQHQTLGDPNIMLLTVQATKQVSKQINETDCSIPCTEWRETGQWKCGSLKYNYPSKCHCNQDVVLLWECLIWCGKWNKRPTTTTATTADWIFVVLVLAFALLLQSFVYELLSVNSGNKNVDCVFLAHLREIYTTPIHTKWRRRKLDLPNSFACSFSIFHSSSSSFSLFFLFRSL